MLGSACSSEGYKQSLHEVVQRKSSRRKLNFYLKGCTCGFSVEQPQWVPAPLLLTEWLGQATDVFRIHKMGIIVVLTSPQPLQGSEEMTCVPVSGRGSSKPRCSVRTAFPPKGQGEVLA